METQMIVWTISMHWIYGLIFGIEHMSADDDAGWMIVIHLGVLRIMIERLTVDDR